MGKTEQYKPSYRRFDRIRLITCPDLTVREIADRIGVSRSALSQWRTGSMSLKFTSLYKLAALLQVRVEDFFDDLPLLERKFNFPGLAVVPEASSSSQNANEILSPEESAILSKYRNLSGDERLKFISVLGDIVNESEKKTVQPLAAEV